jgi:hypothetical protein
MNEIGVRLYAWDMVAPCIRSLAAAVVVVLATASLSGTHSATARLLAAPRPTETPVQRPSPTSTDIRPGELWTDTSGKPITAHGGGIFTHDGVYYWVGEHYGAPAWPSPTTHSSTRPTSRRAPSHERGIRMYRSTDLAHWTDMGNVLTVVDDTNSPIQFGATIERPKGLYCEKTGKYVLWFHNELRGQGYKAAYAAVAVADKPEGPYTLLRSDRCVAGYWPVNYRPTGPGVTTRPDKSVDVPPGVTVHTFDIDDPKYKHLVDGYLRGQDSRDMTLFLDDDGKAYHVYSSENNQTLQIAELTDDYTAHTGRFARIMEGRAREGACILKRAGKYYLFSSATTGWAPNAADVAVSDSVWGPYHPLGNPWQGPPDRTKVSFDSQSTYVLKVAEGKYVFMADRWLPGTLDASPYVWVPVEFDGDKPILRWRDTWDIGAMLGK